MTLLNRARVVAQEPRTVFWWVVTQTYFRYRLGSVGRRTIIFGPLRIHGGPRIHIGSNVRIREGARLESVSRPGGSPGSIRIGDGTTIEQSVHIVSMDSVAIGRDVCISLRCAILDTAHPEGQADDGNRVHGLAEDRRPVTIGPRAFLGAGTVVLRGVDVGQNAIVGANSVVNRDVPPDTVVAGVPARHLRDL